MHLKSNSWLQVFGTIKQLKIKVFIHSWKIYRIKDQTSLQMSHLEPILAIWVFLKKKIKRKIIWWKNLMLRRIFIASTKWGTRILKDFRKDMYDSWWLRRPKIIMIKTKNIRLLIMIKLLVRISIRGSLRHLMEEI